MKAAVFYGPRDIRVEEVEKPKVEAGEILIKVRACGICGSDLHTYKLGIFRELGVPVGDNRLILGHEYSGDVAEVGEGVDGVRVGDRVTAVSMGGMAEYVKTFAFLNGNVFHLPPKVSYEEAATNEPLATSLHAANLASPLEGETILIAGAGIIGLGMLQVLKARCPNRVIVAEISEKRRQMARQLGADFVIDPSTGDLSKQVTELVGTAPMMFSPGQTTSALDIAIDCVGTTAGSNRTPVIEQLLNIVREGAKVVLVGTHEDKVTLDLNVIMGKGLRVLGSVAYGPDELAESLEMIRSGKVKRKPLISHEFSLNEAKEAFETQLMASKSIKVLLKP
jgi:2-desacetyl-2-hydroxyethyl bacteriochlorophyllide A dehydrogenase